MNPHRLLIDFHEDLEEMRALREEVVLLEFLLDNYNQALQQDRNVRYHRFRVQRLRRLSQLHRIQINYNRMYVVRNNRRIFLAFRGH